MEKHKGRPFVLLGVNLDPDRAAAHAGILNKDLNWRSWWDGGDGAIGSAYGIPHIPVLCLIDGNGILRYKIGLESIDQLDDWIEQLLRETERTALIK